jgi:dynein heavy chain, axonemal
MENYYKYWERKIFNALISMTVRALATNKVIWERKPPIIRQTCKYSPPQDFLYNPSTEDMQTQLQKFTNNILDASLSFGRWYKGYCEIVPIKLGDENSDKQFDYSYYEDLCRHGVITSMVREITDMIQGLSRKQLFISDGYLDKD